MNKVWLVARELEGWAEAGGVKDVVRDMAEAFFQLNWRVNILIPLYGFLKPRVMNLGECVWSGTLQHPVFSQVLEVWRVECPYYDLYFLKSPSFDEKWGIYTYTEIEEDLNPKAVRGQGYTDSFSMNLEFQWGCAEFFFQTNQHSEIILGHDGHCGFLSAFLKASPLYAPHFTAARFFLLIHNAGPFYRQEMPVSPLSTKLLNLPKEALENCRWDKTYDPMVCAARYGQLMTVSENYAQELLTGRNDHFSGTFGKFLRENNILLKGITNGISPVDKDPRDKEHSRLPYVFNPGVGDLQGKFLCRQHLFVQIHQQPHDVHGAITRWNVPLYVMQGRLAAQKGVDELIALVERALTDGLEATFLIMGVGEKKYADRLIKIARSSKNEGHFIYINKFEENLSRLVFAAGDFFLMPSEYEPCGLTDLKAQLMGTLPIVHRVGGLVKVRDGETGFSYSKDSDLGLWGAVLRSWEVYRNAPESLDKMRKEAFLSVFSDFDWRKILKEKYIPWMLDNSALGS